MFRRTGQRLPHLYTVEANYNGPKHVSEMAEACGEGTRCASPVPPLRTGGRFDTDAFHQVRPRPCH